MTDGEIYNLKLPKPSNWNLFFLLLWGVAPVTILQATILVFAEQQYLSGSILAIATVFCFRGWYSTLIDHYRETK